MRAFSIRCLKDQAEPYQCDHRTLTVGDSVTQSIRMRFSVHTGEFEALGHTFDVIVNGVSATAVWDGVKVGARASERLLYGY
jgi:hypothetical protein